MKNRWLWVFSLVFVAWQVWVHSSFQYYERSLAQDLTLSRSDLALIVSSFLVPYGLLQVPVGRLLDQGRVDRMLLLSSLMASGFSLTFMFSSDLAGLMLSRIGMGVACAVNFPASALLARRTLPPHRFALAMGLADGLLGWGAAFAALFPFVVPLQSWRAVVLTQTMVLVFVVVIPIWILNAREGAPVASPVAATEERVDRSWSPDAVVQVIRSCLMYAWGGGFVFGVAQYGLVSTLQGWSSTRMQGMTLTMSLGIAIGMFLSGLLGARSERRGKLLLVGTIMNGLTFLVLVLNRGLSVPAALVIALVLGLSLGVQVLAFPIAEEAAPPGQTALTVAIVNTVGTVFGAVMAVISGLILQASAPGELTPVLMTYGLLALFGLAMAGWIQRSAQATA